MWSKGCAEAAYIEALKRDPRLAPAHNGLGIVLFDKRDPAGAIAAYREAIRHDPTYAPAHSNWGNALRAQGDSTGAETAYKEAIRFDPKYASAHVGLGNVRFDKGDWAGAQAAYREAIRLDPKSAVAQNNLGGVLRAAGDPVGAEGAYREAIRLDPTYASAHYRLGLVRSDQGDPAGAEGAYREALRLDPKNALALNTLGVLLRAKGDLDGAVAAFQEVIRIDPKHPLAATNLARTERMRELLPQLPDVLAGRAEPKAPAEARALAELCAQPFLKRYADAARLLEKALVEPAFAADLVASHRYNAACYAARAARGDGTNAPTDPTERATLRTKARDWLRADLALHRAQAASSSASERKAAADRLALWLRDPDLSHVRNPFLLAALPGDEVKLWRTLWVEARATRDEARTPPPALEVAPPPHAKP